MIEHVRHLGRRDRHDALFAEGQTNFPRSNRLAYNDSPTPSCQSTFARSAATPSKNVEIADMRVALQLLLNLERQTGKAAAHVRVPRRDPDPHAARKSGSRTQRLQGRRDQRRRRARANPHARLVHFDNNDTGFTCDGWRTRQRRRRLNEHRRKS